MGPAAGRPRPTKEQVAEKENRVWEMRQTGATIRRIGAELGIPHTTVQAALRRVYKRILAKMEAEVAAEKVAQLYQLDEVVDEAFQAWHRSKAPSVAKSVTRGNGRGGGGPNHAEAVTQETRCGDVAYLEQARRRWRISGKSLAWTSPTKTAETNPAGDAEAFKGRTVVHIPANGRDAGDMPPDGGGASCP